MKLVAVDNDPFAAPAPNLVPVEGDPFAAPKPKAKAVAPLPAWTPPLGYKPTGETMSASDKGPMTMGAGPLTSAMLDPNRPIGQRVLAGAGHVAGSLLRYPVDKFNQQGQRINEGRELTPQDAGDVLQAAAGAEGLRFHEPTGAPKPAAPSPRIEPPPLNETRARTAGLESVGKVADRVRLTPVEGDPFAGKAPAPTAEPPKPARETDPVRELEAAIAKLKASEAKRPPAPPPAPKLTPVAHDPFATSVANPNVHPKKGDNGETIKINQPHTAGVKDGIETFTPDPGHSHSWTPPADWSTVSGKNPAADASPFVPEPGLPSGAGALIESKDGNGYWVVSPTNKFGGFENTLAKGKVDKGSGHDLQTTAIKEVWEETGLKVDITGHVGDLKSPYSKTRYYLAKHKEGSPSDMGWESQAVHWVPKDKLVDFLKNPDEKKMVADFLAKPSPALAFKSAGKTPPKAPPAAPAVPKPKKTAGPKIKPTIPPGTDPHVAKLIEKGNNFFADQFLTQPKTHLPMNQKARIKRAKDMGFNTGLTLYHGTGSKNFIEFKISESKTEPAIFAHDNPKHSASYGGHKILPLWGKFENPLTIEKFGKYAHSKVMGAINKAKAGGYTEIILKGMNDIEGHNVTQYLFLKPENLRARDAAVFDPAKKNSPNLLSAAAATGPHALPSHAVVDPDLKGTVKGIADNLYRTQRRHDRAQLEALDHIRQLPPEAVKLAEKFFNFLEPGPGKPKLTAEEKALFDKHLKPWLEEQRVLYEAIKKMGYEKFLKDYDPDYVHHLVQGKTPEFDDELGIVTHEPNSPWFGSKTLPRSTRSLKNSKYYVLDDGTTRQTIMIDEKGNAYRMLGKKPINIPAKDIHGDVAAGETISIAGKKYNIGRASVAEKEAATNIKYYKNAYLSTISNVVRLKKVAEALKFFEQTKEHFQNDSQMKPLARWPGDKRPIPKDYRGTTLPGWEGWKFDPHIAEAMDDWHNKPGEPWYESLKNITHGIVGTLFMLPFRHMANVAGHYYVGRVGDALAYPGVPGVPFRHVGAALWDVFKQGKMTRDMLKGGSAMQLTKVLNADFNKQVLKGLETNFKQNPKQWDWLFKKLGVAPADIYSHWLKASSVAMWYASDVMMQALVRERIERGLSLEQAIESAEKDIPNYRVNSRVMMDNKAGRAASRYLQNSLFSVFGRYKNNKWRAVADMVNDIVKGGDPGTRKEGVAKALALVSLVAFVAYPLTAAVQAMTGKKDKRASDSGPVDVIDTLKQGAELVAPETMRRLGASDDNVHVVQWLQSLIGLSPILDEGMTQVTGRNPYTGQSVNTAGERADSAVEMINPLQMAMEMATGKTSLLEQALKSTIGMRNTPRPTPAWVEKRDQKAADKYEAQHPFVHAFNRVGRKLQPFTPDAIVNRFLPSQ